ncbi:hypothetical protein SAMN05444358_1011457 [Ruegeria halocynthiae]|uniref:Uncharacterized protein n=1 Tax=Ruegeria halocynthiae TaxID=985054 RepID=A0A1H2VF95_9RHOB|nr:hypothetical protein [Ruegeria halocynthiae]SDW66890.1 hypothetical protein SAMN05444358_1011457 [Ruegeria halocynthiae]
MKTLLSAFILSTLVLTSPAVALGIGMNNLTRNLSFPEPVSEPVTKDQTQAGK